MHLRTGKKYLREFLLKNYLAAEKFHNFEMWGESVNLEAFFACFLHAQGSVSLNAGLFELDIGFFKRFHYTRNSRLNFLAPITEWKDDSCSFWMLEKTAFATKCAKKLGAQNISSKLFLAKIAHSEPIPYWENLRWWYWQNLVHSGI